MGLLSSSEKLSSNLWLAIPIERANSCSSFLLFQITMFKFIVLSSLVLMLCIDSVFPATTVTTTSTSISIYSSTTKVVFKSFCIKTTAGIVACRRSEEFCTKSQLCQWTSGWNQPQTISTTDSALCRCRRCLASILIPSASRTCRKETTISSRENLTSRLLCRKTAPDMARLCPGSSSAIFFVQHKLPLCKSLPLPLPLLKLLKLLKLRQQRRQ